MFKKIWLAIRGEGTSTVHAWLRVLVAAGVLGVVFMIVVVAGATGLAWTETLSFCTSCHEMRDNVFAEYKETIHDRNRTGVQVICADCHVPRDPPHLIKRKIEASFELWGHFITGVIDTKEKFRAHRPVLAEHVWTRMLTTNSLECRNCHKPDHMDEDKQADKAKNAHARAKNEGMTCIECHYGIAHDEPKGPGPQELKKKLGIGKLPWVVE